MSMNVPEVQFVVVELFAKISSDPTNVPVKRASEVRTIYLSVNLGLFSNSLYGGIFRN